MSGSDPSPGRRPRLPAGGVPAHGVAARRGPDSTRNASGDRPAAPHGPGVLTRRHRVLALGTVAVALATPYVVALATVWSSTGAEVDLARRERAGAALLRPVVQLIAATSVAQSGAVATSTPSAADIQAAVQAVDAADARQGGLLGTSRRWADLRSHVEELLAIAPQGAAAYPRYSQVVDLETAFAGAVGDAAGTVLDRRLDTTYLLDAALVRVPSIMVDAGRAQDLILLDERYPGAVPTPASAGAVLLENVRRSADAMDAGLRKSFATTVSPDLGPGMLSQLDDLESTVAVLAPPLSTVGAASPTRSSATVKAARAPVDRATLGLETAAFDQLDRLLGARADAPAGTRRTVLLVTLAGLLVVGAVAWVAGPRQRRADAEPRPGAEPGPVAGAGPVPGAAPDEIGPALVAARDLLRERQLVRVGRALRPTGTRPTPDDSSPAAGDTGPGPGGGQRR